MKMKMKRDSEGSGKTGSGGYTGTRFFFDDEGSTSSFTWYLELITQDTLFDVIWEKRAESYHFFPTHLETEGSERTGSGGRTR